MKKTSCFLLAILFVFITCACHAASGTTSAAIGALTGDEFAGRLPGTPGNQKAAEYVEQHLAGTGFAPLPKHDMAIPFSATIPAVRGTSLVIDGTALAEGKDYTQPVWGPMTIEGVLGEKSAESAGDAIPVLGTGGEPLLYLVQGSSRLQRRDMYGAGTGLPRLNVAEQTMELAAQHVGAPVKFVCDADIRQIDIPNVIGVLPGEDRSRAVVVGAHFDHMGTAAGTVYRGALDNASGVAALMAVAEKLAGARPAVDVVAAFWNAEEFAQQGSAAARTMLDETYEEYCYINIDCIGLANGASLQISTANSSGALAGKLADLLAQNGFGQAETSEEQMASDHMSFPDRGAVTVGASMDTPMEIHTPKDTVEQLDTRGIERFARALAAVLETAAPDLLSSSAATAATRSTSIMWPEGDYEAMSPSEQYAYTEFIQDQLAFDEMIIFRMGRDTINICGRDGQCFSSLKAAQALYPGFQARESLGAYVLTGIQIYGGSSPANPQDASKVNEVIKLKFDISNISTVHLTYEAAGKALRYTEAFYGSGPIENMLESYFGRYEPAPDGLDGWIGYDESADGESCSYFEETDAGYFVLRQGDLYMNKYGFHDVLVSGGYGVDSLLEIVKMADDGEPFIVLAGSAKT